MIAGLVESALLGVVAGSVVLLAAVAAGWVSAAHAAALIVALGAVSGALRAAQHRTGVTTLAPVDDAPTTPQEVPR